MSRKLPMQPQPAPEAPTEPEPRTRRVYTAAETSAQMAFVADNLPTMTARQIYLQVKKQAEPTPLDGLSLSRVMRLADRVFDIWSTEDPRKVEQRRARALRRLYADAQRARFGVVREGKVITTPNPSATARFEELIARLEGTLAPVQVTVDQRMTIALEQVVRGMTPGEMDKLVAEQLELRARANAIEVPALPPAPRRAPH